MVESRKCPVCKLVKPYTDYYKSNQTKTGLRSYCKSCEKIQNSKREVQYKQTRKEYRKTEKYKSIKRAYYVKNKNKILKENKSWAISKAGKLASYKQGAKLRNIEWAISDEQFYELWGKNCFYCNDPVERIGVDRVDNNKGYVNDNIVPCCSACNRMKLNMKVEDFKSQVCKIYKNLNP